MGDFDNVILGEYFSASLAANTVTPTTLQKRDIWDGFETIRTPTVTVTAGGLSIIRVFRGVVSGAFVFNNGSPPIGATDIVVVAELVE